MKKVWFGLGAIVIAILLLLATRFVQFKEVYDNGHAVMDNGVASMLMRAIEEDNIAEELPMYSFKALDIIFKRGNSFYMGESKKEKIDLDYPLYVYEGSAIQIVESRGKLYNNEYNAVDVYEGLTINEGISYNQNDERADACTFLFYEVGNGTYINTQAMGFIDKGNERTIPLNSIIYFARDHMTYYIYNDGQLEYRCAETLSDSSIFVIDGQNISYYDLLIKLGVIYEPVKKDNNKEFDKNSNPDEITEEAPLVTASPEPTAKPERQKPERPDTEKERPERVPASGGQAKPPTAPVAPSDDDAPPAAKPQSGTTPPPQSGSGGVRPDSMRPDKQGETAEPDDDREQVKEYVKPEVSVYDAEGGVYWIKIPVAVNDPAKRIHPNRKVQIEVYEIDPKTGKEKLVQRTYTGSNKLLTEDRDNRLLVGDGAIKPGTKYRINAYFTYYNEYDEIIVESIELSNPYVTTSVLPEGACVTFTDYYPDDDTKSSQIDYYYDDRLELAKVSLNATETNEHALYGIKKNGGIKLTITGKSANVAGVKNVYTVDPAVIAEIKRGNITNIISPSGLRADATYEYVLTAEDFFGDEIVLVNNSGTFETCKARPKASFEVVDNRIGSLTLKLDVKDINNAALFYGDDSSDRDNKDSNKKNTDIYLVLSTQTMNPKSPYTLEDIEYNLAHDGYADPDGDSPILYAVKIPREAVDADGNITINGYSGAGGQGLVVDGLNITIQNLPLDEGMVAYAFADYDLGNGAGEVRFSKIGEKNFTTASINTLGYVYVTTDIGNVTSNSAEIFYTLNTARTNADLINYLNTADFKILSTGGADPVQYSHMEIKDDYMNLFKQGQKAHMDPATYFADLEADRLSLESATDYKIEPEVYALYNGKAYPVKTILSSDTFKTMKRPVEVDVKNLLLAAGTMRFDVNIYDKDNAIVGTGANTAVMNIYSSEGVLVYSRKINKKDNPDDYTSIEVTGLTTGMDYTIRIMALEYNEGYTNATFESNKLLYNMTFAETVRLAGDIKLYDLKRIDGNMTATVKTVFDDPDYNMHNYGYYVDVYKTAGGVKTKVTEKYDPDGTGFPSFLFEDYMACGDNGTVWRNTDYVVAENCTYDMELYVVINSQRLVLDTLTFTTEQEVIPIYDEYDFIYKMKLNQGRGKFLICDNLNFNSNYVYTETERHGFNPEDYDKEKISYDKNTTPYLVPGVITTISDVDKRTDALKSKKDFYFDGIIDGQGYDFKYNVLKDNNYMFGSFGSHSEVYDMNLVFSQKNATQYIYDEAFFVINNYGYIHDIFATYAGGKCVDNRYIGLICRTNTMSGRIENFVVHNTHDEETDAFSAQYNAGLVCYLNYGQIKNGYVYGDDIFSDIEAKAGTQNINVGGIVGYQHHVGITSNVYSLVNVITPDQQKISNKKPALYGNIVGNAYGKLENAYGIGESSFNPPYKVDTETYNPDSGPVIGRSDVKTRNVYTWYSSNRTYSDAISAKQKRIATTTLCDSSWQSKILGEQFDTSMVDTGFYPHVELSKELPRQDYIELPEREQKTIDLISAEVENYLYQEITLDKVNEDDADRKALIEKAAIVNVRLYNPKGAVVENVIIDNLETQILGGTTVNVDGYTEFKLLVYNPTDFVSSYKIKSIRAVLNKKSQSFEVEGTLAAEFYLPVSTPKEWKENIIGKPTKNSRIVSDIDFTGVAEADIRKASDVFSGIINGSRLVETKDTKRVVLDGNILRDKTDVDTDAGYFINVEESIYDKGYSLDNITKKTYVIYNLTGIVKNLSLRNLKVGSYSSFAASPSFIYTTTQGALVSNVHIDGEVLYGYNYIGGIVGYAQTSSEIKDCSVQNLEIYYKESVNSNTTGWVGGVVGDLYYSRISNCYAVNVNLQVGDIQCCEGAGGVVGYGYYSYIESIYAEGEVNARGSNVGGVIGSYYGNKEQSTMKNLIAKVNAISYQDCVGGLIGYTEITDMLSADTNMSGVAYGNVYAHNTDAEDVSFTVGAQMGEAQHYYGTYTQLLNGMPNEDHTFDDHTYALLSEEDMKNPRVYSERVTMAADAYDYSYAEQMYLPHLYYQGTDIELPDQPNISMITDSVSKNEINVKQIMPSNQYTRLSIFLINPKGYKVTGITVEDEFLVKEDTFKIDNDATKLVQIDYYSEQEQKHWKDSYSLLEIQYERPDGTTGKSDFRDQPVRIPVCLYKDIYNYDEWTDYINKENNYGNYENYRIRNDISFAGKTSYTLDAKLGRLVGFNTSNPDNRAVLSDITINQAQRSLIFRMNSELSKMVFENCTLTTRDRSVVGLIGTCSGKVYDVDFKDVIIQENSIVEGTKKAANIDSIGIIGYQVGGRFEKVRVENCEIKTPSVVNKGNYYRYVGGLVGQAKSNAKFFDVVVTDTKVTATSHVGGVVGRVLKGSFDGVEVCDCEITANGGYVGGVVGENSSGRTTKGNIPYMRNVNVHSSLTADGTPTYKMRVTIDSAELSTVSTVSSYLGRFAGGIAGRECGYKNGWTSSYDEVRDKNLLVDGVVVTGYSNNIGGAFGEAFDHSNTYVTNTYVRVNEKSPTKGYIVGAQDVGGIAGNGNYYCYYNLAENVTIEATNHTRVGGAYGYRNGTGMYDNEANNCTVTVTKTPGYTGSVDHVGGLCGYSEGTIGNSLVINTNVEARDSDNVGGVLGYASCVIQNSGYYGDPKTTNKAYASADYKIIGHDNVGGLVGWLKMDKRIDYCYTNANVLGHFYVGGLAGAYDNGYTRPSSAYTYSSAYIRYSYAAGTVEAEDFAGGLVGQTTMATSSIATNTHKAQGGRVLQPADGGGAKSGGANEYSYTYFNYIFVDSVKAIARDEYGQQTGYNEHAYIFSGTTDGFEGSVDTYNTATSKMWNARGTYIWDGIRINGEEISIDGTSRKYWDTQKTTSSALYNVRYVKTGDLTDPNAAIRVYRNNNWYGQTYDSTIVNTTTYELKKDHISAGGTYFRLFCGPKVTLDSEWLNAADRSIYEGQYYLPLARANGNTNGKTLDDWVTRRQSELKVRIPVPTYSGEAPHPRQATLDTETEPTASIYISGVDTVNVEFSDNLVCAGYYRLTYMDLNSNESTVVEEGPIEQRVITYKTDMNGYIRVEYGYGLVEDPIGDKYTTDFSTFAEGKHAMVYGDKYYAVYYNPDTNEGNLVYGNISDKIESSEELYANGRYTGKLNVVKKNFINMYGGKALADDGSIYDADGNKVGVATPGLTRCDYATPLQRVSMNGTIVETYGGFTQYTSSIVVSKNLQQFSGIDGTTAMYYPALDNVKNTSLIYSKNGKSYNTVLGSNGQMVELQQSSDDYGAPANFRNAGIVEMTNNYDTTIPVVLVVYATGDVAGYNYKTGEWVINLTHNSSDDKTMSLLEYAGVYFDAPLKTLTMAHSEYEPIVEVIQGISEGKTLEAMVTGKGHETGEDTALSGDNKEMPGMNQAVKDPNKDKTPDEEEKVDLSDESFDPSVEVVPDNGSNKTESGTNTAENVDGKYNEGIVENKLPDTETQTLATVGTEGTGTLAGEATANGTSTENGMGSEDGENVLEGANLESKETDTEELDGVVAETEAVTEDKNEPEKAEKSSEEENEKINKNNGSVEDKEYKHIVEDNYYTEDATRYRLVSYAGTPSKEAKEDPSYNEEYLDDIYETDTKNVVISGNYSMAFNPVTGVYEIIDMSRFVRYQDYQSENQRLNIEDIAAAAGYAEKTDEKKKVPGLPIYIAVALATLLGAGFVTAKYRKVKESK